MADARTPVGPTGEAVRTNVRRLREAQNLTYAELTRRLTEVGRPIATLGLRRLEAGERRVDTDDLTALALVLGVSPATLLMPTASGAGEDVELTGMSAPAWQAWEWLLAVRPPQISTEELRRFLDSSRPAWEDESSRLMYDKRDMDRARDEGSALAFRALSPTARPGVDGDS